MPEQLQRILNRISEWWKHFSTRQKAAIISTAAIVVVALSILGVTMTKPTYTPLVTASDTAEAATIKKALDGADETIDYKQSQDGLTFSVNTKQEAAARLTLGSNGIPSEGYSIDDALNGSFSTTEADKTKKYQVYLESQLAKDIESIDAVDSATVSLNIPANDGTIISKQKDSHAAIILKLNKDLSNDQAAGIAMTVVTALGSDDASNVNIVDTNGNTLFSGGDAATTSVQASQNQSVQAQAENAVAQKVKNILAGENDGSIYDNAKVSVKLDMDFSQVNTKEYEYWVKDGNTQGYLSSKTTSNSKSTNGIGGTPGTDSNNDTTYVTEDGSVSTSETNDESDNYLPNETITDTKGETGKINYDNSSISIVANKYVVYDEDQMKASGQLQNQTFDEFVAANSATTTEQVDPAVLTAVSKATGVAEGNISIIVNDVPTFKYSTGGRSFSDYLQIILAVLIMLLLLFVVIRTFRAPKEEEITEVTPEDLLIEQQEENGTPLETIQENEKSEARVLIEKFVDENPEAAAALLRNWLNDDWG